jgi:branched-chain amino acid transport system permease protein
MEFFTISLLNGISYGLLLFMLSSGLTLIFSMMGVLNFAHASFYMLGRTSPTRPRSWSASGPRCSSRRCWWRARRGVREVLPAPRAQVRPRARTAHHLRPVFIILEMVQLVWGTSSVDYRVPPSGGPLFTLYGTQFPAYRGS